MKVRLKKEEAEILETVPGSEKLKSGWVFERHPSCVTLQISEDDATELRELCSDHLLSLGFDKDYKPNSAGVLLESLIDKLFVE